LVADFLFRYPLSAIRYPFSMPAALSALLLLGLSTALPAQEIPVRTIEGIVRAVGDSGAPVAGASVQIGRRSATTDPGGRFRIDSIPYGEQLVVIRGIGYQPVRTRISVYAGGQRAWEFFLPRSPFRLPDVAVEARRTGIYGVVTDVFQRPLAGAAVEVIGNRGGTRVTDSAGRFAFSDAVVGAYMVRARHAGYAERRVMLSVERGRGRELSIGLTAGAGRQVSNAEAAALFDLRRALAFGLKRHRMVGEELERYGSLSVCDVPRVRALVGRVEVGVLNGERVLQPGELCTWNMDEVAMIQFFEGKVTRTPRGPVRGPGQVVIWEKWE
jgi:hypothetical protein